MKKKVYIKPEICVLQLDIQAALAVSSVQQAPEEDYTNENVKGLWDKKRQVEDLGRLSLTITVMVFTYSSKRAAAPERKQAALALMFGCCESYFFSPK